MIADKDLNIDHSDNSAPWLERLLKAAAKNTGHSAYIFKYSEAEEDDHLPFAQRGVPVLDVIDAHYGPPPTPPPTATTTPRRTRSTRSAPNLSRSPAISSSK